MVVLEVIAKIVIPVLMIAYIIKSLAEYDEKKDERCEYDPNSQDCRTCPFPCDQRNRNKEDADYEQLGHNYRRE